MLILQGMGRWVLVFFCFFFTLIPSRAQKYGNEWYDASKAHVRIGIAENGLYRIDFFVLDYVFRQAGVSIRLLEASKLQIWSRGAQVPMTVSDQGDNRIGPGDFLEFFALKADGSLDETINGTRFPQHHGTCVMNGKPNNSCTTAANLHGLPTATSTLPSTMMPKAGAAIRWVTEYPDPCRNLFLHSIQLLMSRPVRVRN
jgi:hypothetical protein